MSSGVTQPGTVPDLAKLYRLAGQARAMFIDDLAGIRWRMTCDDFSAVLRVAPPFALTPPIEPDDSFRLFGIPVEQVPTERGRWPELVLTCDYRSAEGTRWSS